MKRILILGYLGIMAFGLTSCGKSKVLVDGHSGHGHEEAAVNFEKGKGVLLSAESIKSLDIQMMDISDRSLVATLTVTAQIYRGADEMTSAHETFKNGYAYASASIPINSLNDVKMSKLVTIRKSDQSEERSARLMRVDESLRSITQSAEALLEIEDSSFSLPVGTFMRATFYFEQSRIVTAIPHSALLRTPEGYFVYVQNGKHLLRTPVQIGAGDKDWVEIKDGLLSGDAIAANKVETLQLIELRATKGGGHCH